jgi:membrane-bound lytic murein transglycosylase B
VAPAQQLPPVAQTPPPGQAAPLPPVADVPRAPFPEWLTELRKEAVEKGISQRTVDAALSDIQPVPVVIERDRTQAERTLALDKYLKRRLDRKTIRTARSMAAFHAQLLARVSRRYGVPSSVVVSVWGLESNFGRFSGVRPTVPALATLAYDNRRSALFRQELFDALRILDRGDIDVAHMRGSWAGAMGQPQFMPSTYLKFAQDFDGDGRTDIWGSQADAFASIANFLKQEGWQEGATWGRAVKVPAVAQAKISAVPRRTQGCEAVRQMTEAAPWSRWKALGVKLEGKQKAPVPDTRASLVRAGSRNFLVFDNYRALLQYNCAHAYALSVALLSEQLSGAAAKKPAAPKGKKISYPTP